MNGRRPGETVLTVRGSLQCAEPLEHIFQPVMARGGEGGGAVGRLIPGRRRPPGPDYGGRFGSVCVLNISLVVWPSRWGDYEL